MFWVVRFLCRVCLFSFCFWGLGWHLGFSCLFEEVEILVWCDEFFALA